MKRTLILFYTMVLLLTGAVPALAAETGQEQTGRDTPEQAQFIPVSVDEYSERDQLRVKNPDLHTGYENALVKPHIAVPNG